MLCIEGSKGVTNANGIVVVVEGQAVVAADVVAQLGADQIAVVLVIPGKSETCGASVGGAILGGVIGAGDFVD